jgi:hypothetical protein
VELQSLYGVHLESMGEGKVHFDILTVMSDRVNVKFVVDMDNCEVDKRHWCNICK